MGLSQCHSKGRSSSIFFSLNTLHLNLFLSEHTGRSQTELRKLTSKNLLVSADVTLTSFNHSQHFISRPSRRSTPHTRVAHQNTASLNVSHTSSAFVRPHPNTFSYSCFKTAGYPFLYLPHCMLHSHSCCTLNFPSIKKKQSITPPPSPLNQSRLKEQA